MRERHDADLAPGAHQLEDHLGPGPGLARSRRPLHGQHRLVEERGQPRRGVVALFARSGQRRPRCLAGARGKPEQQLARGAPAGRGRAVHAPRPSAARPSSAPFWTSAVIGFRGDERRRMRPRMLRAPLEVERAVERVERHDPAGRALRRGIRPARRRPSAGTAAPGRTDSGGAPTASADRPRPPTPAVRSTPRPAPAPRRTGRSDRRRPTTRRSPRAGAIRAGRRGGGATGASGSDAGAARSRSARSRRRRSSGAQLAFQLLDLWAQPRGPRPPVVASALREAASSQAAQLEVGAAVVPVVVADQVEDLRLRSAGASPSGCSPRTRPPTSRRP